MGGPIGVILGLYWGFIGIMENKMETIRIRGYIRGSIGIMENKMETTKWHIYTYVYIYMGSIECLERSFPFLGYRIIHAICWASHFQMLSA